MNELDISGLDKIELLRRLHAGTHAVGMGHLHDLGREMTYGEAKEIWTKAVAAQGHENRVMFDYVRGRPLKVWFEGDKLTGVRLYDRDSFPGNCARIVEQLRAGGPGGKDV
jgi:hypothetical protein